MPVEDQQRDTAGDSKSGRLIREIRDFREYAESRLRKIREESMKDRRAVAGDPWAPEDRKARQENHLPCVNSDELSQYVNAAINNVRVNKRGIKVEPAGNGSTDETAEFRENLIRSIEYRSKAHQVYVLAFQQMVEGSYGYFRISRQYVSQDPDADDEQDIGFRPILNQDSVLYDPDCREPDGSDARRVLILDPWPKEEFTERFPDAKLTDFGDNDGRIRKDWIQDRTVVVAEYFKLHSERIWNKAHTRKVERKWVCKYLTNGVEILETEEFLRADGKPMGTHIPVVRMWGPQRFVDLGEGPEPVLGSMVRLPREPQLALAFLVSQEITEGGLAPKVPFLGHEGVFDTKTDWANIHRVPTGFAESKAFLQDPNGTWHLMPLPERTQFTPNFAAYEVAKESRKRAVQASMGISGLPTAAQRQNEKSGKALDKIEAMQQIGSYHFNEAYENALQYAGRIIDQWIPAIYDTPRDVGIRKKDESHKVVRINEPSVQEDGEEASYIVEEASHDITIETGPSNESQRDAASDFLDTLVSNLPNIPPPGSPQAKMLALAIRMKQLGPKGDQMADILDPPEGDQNAAAAAAQGQQQMMVMQEQMVKMQAELQKLQLEKAGRVIDNEYKSKEADKDREVKLAIAEITTNSQQQSERLALVVDMLHKLVDSGHAAALQASEQAHEAGMTAADQAHESGEAETQRGYEADQADAQRAHDSAEGAAGRQAEAERAKQQGPRQ